MDVPPPLPPKPRHRHKNGREASWLDNLKKLDAYPKTLDEFRVRTSQGGLMSAVTIVFMLVLLMSQFSNYWHYHLEESMVIDKTLNDQIVIRFNVTFPRVDCSVISIDTLDASGGHPPLFRDEVYEIPLDTHGRPFGERKRQRISPQSDTIVREADFEKRDTEKMKPSQGCGSCYGAGREGQCCKTCEDVKAAYNARGWSLVLSKEIVQCADEYQEFGVNGKTNGCLVFGKLHVPKGAGSFHFAPSNQLKMSHSLFTDFLAFSHRSFNASHTINELTFGDVVPNMKSPLARRSKLLQRDDAGVYQYFLNIVPTDFVQHSGRTVHTNQYSATEHFHRVIDGRTPPGVFFYWDVSPIRMVSKETSRPMSDLLVDLFAAIGGVYMVMRMVDHVLHTWTRNHHSNLGTRHVN